MDRPIEYIEEDAKHAQCFHDEAVGTRKLEEEEFETVEDTYFKKKYQDTQPSYFGYLNNEYS